MKHIMTITLLLLSLMAGAQTSMKGRMYANPNTLHLSTDGKYIYGIMDEGKKKTRMTLTRTR